MLPLEVTSTARARRRRVIFWHYPSTLAFIPNHRSVYRRHQRSSTDLDHHVRSRSSCVIWSRSSALWSLSLNGYGRNDDDDAIDDDDDHDDDDDDDDDDDAGDDDDGNDMLMMMKMVRAI